MAELVWDDAGDRLYETGIDKVVLFPFAAGGGYANGVAWNGVTAINENPSGGEATALYADNIKYLNLMSVEELGLSIEAYDSPDEFDECDGSVALATGVTIGQQERKHFGLCYRTLIGNDEEGTNYGYKIHIVYDCVASPTEKSHSTVNDSPEAEAMSWDVNTVPIAVSGYKPTASVVIDSTKVAEAKLTLIKNSLYGTANAPSTILTPAGILEIINAT